MSKGRGARPGVDMQQNNKNNKTSDARKSNNQSQPRGRTQLNGAEHRGPKGNHPSESISRADNRRQRDEPRQPTQAQGQRLVDSAAAAYAEKLAPLVCCANCWERGHEVKHCIKPDSEGTVNGCPKCNQPHLWEDCQFRSGTPEEDLRRMVEERPNKPPLRARTLCWFRVWDRCGRPSITPVWTREFALNVRSRNGRNLAPELKGWTLDKVNYRLKDKPELMAELLPRDPATRWSINPREVLMPKLQTVRHDKRDARSRSPDRPRHNPSQVKVQGRPVPQPSVNTETRANVAAPVNRATSARLDSSLPSGPAVFALPMNPAHPATPISTVQTNPSLPLVNTPAHPPVQAQRELATSAPVKPEGSQETSRAGPVNCGNCGKQDCSARCPCAACGKQACNISVCPHAEKKCLCERFPQHLMEDCTEVCRPCWEAQPNKADDTAFVRAWQCPTHCPACGRIKDAAHGAEACRNTKCRGCGVEGDHWTQDCETLMCPNSSCSSQPTSPTGISHYPTGSCQCCRTCGHPDLPPIPIFNMSHVCQWTREWRWVAYKSVSTEWRLKMVVLRCRNDPTHRLVSSEQLAEVRKAGHARMYEEAAGFAPVIHKLIECRQCFEEAYDGGVYEKQIPGVSRA